MFACTVQRLPKFATSLALVPVSLTHAIELKRAASDWVLPLPPATSAKVLRLSAVCVHPLRFPSLKSSAKNGTPEATTPCELRWAYTVGASATAVTLIIRVSVSVALAVPLPSLVLMDNVAAPLKSPVGLYAKPLSAPLIAAAVPLIVTELLPLAVMTAPANVVAVSIPLVTDTVVVKLVLSVSDTVSALPLAALNTRVVSSVVDWILGTTWMG